MPLVTHACPAKSDHKNHTSIEQDTAGEMTGRSSPFHNREQVPLRKSSFFKTGLRKTSSVTFGENKMIEIEKREEAIKKENKENDEKLRNIREDKHLNDEEEDVPITHSRRLTDSLKIKRKKSKEGKVVDRETEDDRDETEEMNEDVKEEKP